MIQPSKNPTVRMLRFMLDNVSQFVFWTDIEGNFLEANEPAIKLFGYPRDELLAMKVADIDDQITPESHRELLTKLETQDEVIVQSRPFRRHGIARTFEFLVRKIEFDGVEYLCTFGNEIDLEKQTRDRVLESIANGAPLETTLSLIVELAERTRIGMIGSIMLLNEQGRLQLKASTQLPQRYIEKINSITSLTDCGSIGTCVDRGENVSVSDISSSALWKTLSNEAAEAGLIACWSVPVFSGDRNVIGAFATYFRKPLEPDPVDQELLKSFSILVGIAVERHMEHKQLKESERQMRLISDSFPVFISYIDKNYRYQFNNAQYTRAFGRSVESLKNLPIRELIGETEFARVKPALDKALGGKTVSFEAHTANESNSPVGAYEISFIPDINSEGNVEGVYGLTLDVSERRAIEKAVLNATTIEQRRIGQDLHDGVGQELTGLGMIADTLQLRLGTTDAQSTLLAEKLNSGIKRTLRQVKLVARGMNPVENTAAGINSALTEMARHVEDLHEIICEFVCDPEGIIESDQVATNLFRIAQEATTNAAKHSGASKITISLRRSDKSAVMSVSDDGAGIAQDQVNGRGMGFRTMKFRAEAIGGSLRIDSGKHGTTVECLVHDAPSERDNAVSVVSMTK